MYLATNIVIEMIFQVGINFIFSWSLSRSCIFSNCNFKCIWNWNFPRNYFGHSDTFMISTFADHVKTILVSLFFLFLVNAILSVPRSVPPEKINISNIFQAESYRIYLVFAVFCIFTILELQLEF